MTVVAETVGLSTPPSSRMLVQHGCSAFLLSAACFTAPPARGRLYHTVRTPVGQRRPHSDAMNQFGPGLRELDRQTKLLRSERLPSTGWRERLWRASTGRPVQPGFRSKDWHGAIFQHCRLGWADQLVVRNKIVLAGTV